MDYTPPTPAPGYDIVAAACARSGRPVHVKRAPLHRLAITAALASCAFPPHHHPAPPVRRCLGCDTPLLHALDDITETCPRHPECKFSFSDADRAALARAAAKRARKAAR